jgi:hypothetical protein
MERLCREGIVEWTEKVDLSSVTLRECRVRS